MFAVQTSIEVQKALGRYRARWYSLLPSTVIFLLFFGRAFLAAIDRHFSVGELAPVVLWGAAVVAVWLPQTIVSVRGIRLVWRFRFIPWSNVARLYWSKPGEQDLQIGLTDGSRIRVPGLPGDRLPGILILARQATAH